MRKIGVGIIGLSADGGWGATAHYPSLKKLNNLFEINGLVASSREKAKKASLKYDVPFYTDNVEELASRDDIDLVVVAVNLPQHQSIISKIIPYQKAIYCEWPLGISSQESLQIKQRAEKYKIKTFIGLQALNSPYINEIKRITNDQKTGKLLSCVIRGSDPTRGRIIDSRYEYAQLKENGVNTLTIPFAHLFSALEYLLGEIEEVNSMVSSKFSCVTVKDTGKNINRTAIDHVLYQGLAKNALLDTWYKGGNTGLYWEMEFENIKLQIEAESGHVQYEPLAIKIIGEDGLSTEVDSNSAIGLNLVNTYSSVYSDLLEDTHCVPSFSDAVILQAKLEKIAENYYE